MENRETIAGIPIEDLKKLSIKYLDNDDYNSLQLIALKINTAQCARLSHFTFGESPTIDYEKDIKLHNQLLESKHASPMEHCAQCQNNDIWYANFKGWKSYRKILEETKYL